MRDPVAPIPSPFAASDTARGFWRTTARPPPPRPDEEGPVVSYDPTRLLPARGDMLGLDRRAVARRAGADTTTGSSITAARHVDVRAFFGLATSVGWALVSSLCVSPSGVLVRLVDPRDPELDDAQIRVARSVFRRLAPVLDRQASSDDEPSSPLAAIGGCVLAPRVVADLSGWANGKSARRSREPARALLATLVLAARPRTAKVGARSAFVRIPGEIVPLNDPQRDLLGVALQPDALARFTRALAELPHAWRDTGLVPG